MPACHSTKHTDAAHRHAGPELWRHAYAPQQLSLSVQRTKASIYVSRRQRLPARRPTAEGRVRTIRRGGFGFCSFDRQKQQGDFRRRRAKPEGSRFPSQRLSNPRFLYLLQISQREYRRPHLGFRLYRRSASRCFRPLCAMLFQTCPDQATFA